MVELKSNFNSFETKCRLVDDEFFFPKENRDCWNFASKIFLSNYLFENDQ